MHPLRCADFTPRKLDAAGRATSSDHPPPLQSLPVRRSPWHLHPHIADDVLSDRRRQEGSQDLQGVQEGV